MEPSEPIKLCLAEMERYADNIEYESHAEICTNDVKYKSERKADQEGGIKLSYVEALAHLSTLEKVEAIDVTSMYIGVDALIADLDLGQIQELSVQQLVNEESILGSVPPRLCSKGSDSSSSGGNSSSASELSEFTVTGSTIHINTAGLTDISIE